MDSRRILLTNYINEFPRGGDRCVYLHKKINGEIYFVGIDFPDLRFSKNPPFYWKEYTENELQGKYEVELLVENVSKEVASEIKERVLELYADDLINTVNFNRKFDLEKFEVYSSALKTYETLKALAIFNEKNGDTQSAAGGYMNAYAAYIKAMNSRNYDAGEQYLKAHSPPPPSQLVDRLSLCLLKLGRNRELVDFGARYLSYFTRKTRTTGELAFLKRVAKAESVI